jgi:hypothetical protein
MKKPVMTPEANLERLGDLHLVLMAERLVPTADVNLLSVAISELLEVRRANRMGDMFVDAFRNGDPDCDLVSKLEKRTGSIYVEFRGTVVACWISTSLPGFPTVWHGPDGVLDVRDHPFTGDVAADVGGVVGSVLRFASLIDD